MKAIATQGGALMAARQEVIAVPRPPVASAPRVQRRPVSARIAAERVGHSAAQAGLLALMVVGTVALVTAIPAAWLWVASQLTESYIYGRAPLYLMLGVGIPVSMALGGKLLACVGAAYERRRGTRQRSVPDAWRRSRHEGRHSAAPVTALDVIVTVIASVAVIGLIVYLVLPPLLVIL